jgi:hypothetical protein
VRVESSRDSSCCLRHSPANRLNVKIGPKVEARLVTSLPHPSSPLACRIHQHPTAGALSIVFPSSSQHWLQIHSRIKLGSIAHCSTSALPRTTPPRAARQQTIRVASHRAQRLPPTTTAHCWARISIYRIVETSSSIRPPKCSIQSRFWPRPDLWRVFGWLPTWSANSRNKMCYSRTSRTM